MAQGIDELLEYKVPSAIPRLVAPGAALVVRPDFQLCPLAGPPGYALVATELELCPSAHGFAHAMQVGYGLATDLAHAFARLLAGRELLIVGSSQWSEFLFEQLAFCKALAGVGARARVLYDTPLAELAAQIRAGQRWQPPMFGISERPATWDTDLHRRIAAHGLAPFLWPDAAGWPDQVGDAVVFRFGYFDCFAPAHLARMREWAATGATFINPLSFYLDSKAVLAALQLPVVRAVIARHDPAILASLDRGIPTTILVRPETIAQLRAERAQWVIKYAGYDGGNQAWGGRSLRLGAHCTPDEWAELLEGCAALPWPVVAQRLAPSAQISIDYLDAGGAVHRMERGTTRLRSFLLRAPDHDAGGAALVCGSHLTVVSGASHVAESTASVQAPVVYH
jgi:hypothetical protein